MSILFRCPCGRSMVVESDRAGTIVNCPNCKRALRVPSGEERGVKLAPVPAAARTRVSRRCQRCAKDVPVDSQICPHCKAILLDGPPAAPAQAAPVKAVPVTGGTKAASKAAAHAAGALSAATVVYGGYRGNWWTRLSQGAKAGVLIGAAVGAIIIAIVVYVVAVSYQHGQLVAAREQAQNALTQGRKLENIGKFQEAYELYAMPSDALDRLKQSDLAKDRELAALVEARFNTLHGFVPQPKSREAVQWKPKNQQEFDEAMALLREKYPEYRQWCLQVADIGIAAAQFGKTNPSQEAFDEKVTQTLEAFTRLVRQTTPQQRAQFSFGQLITAIRELTSANRNWNNESRKIFLNNAEGYFGAMKELVSKPGYPDAIW